MTEPRKADILKSAALIVKDKKILYTREHGELFLAPPGGSLKNGEDPIACLRRELREELGVTKFSIGNNGQPFYTTPLAPAATQPDKLLQMMFYFVELEEEPRPTYNHTHPVDGEDIEEILWIGAEDLLFVHHDDAADTVEYKPNEAGVRLTHANETYVFPKLIELGIIDRPST